MAKQIVILGAGYAGLVCALEARKRLASHEAEITLVNKHSYHQLITQLHETVVGVRSDRSTRISLNAVLGGKAIDLLKGTVTGIMPHDREVALSDGRRISYDYLVIALGSETEYFDIAGLKDHAFILKSINQARLLRTHIESCFARYPYEQRPELLRFVVGGAGFSGIELVGELADALPHYAREAGIDPELVALYSIEAAPGILPGFDEELVQAAATSLESRRVQILTGIPIVQVEKGTVHLQNGEMIAAETIVWTGGVRGNKIVIAAGLATEPRGRAIVNQYLQSTSTDNVYVVGDCAIVFDPDGRPLPPTAQLAWQAGSACGKFLYYDIKGGTKEPFVPHIVGSLASLGRKDAVGKILKSHKMYGRVACMAKEASQLRYLAKIGAAFANRQRLYGKK